MACGSGAALCTTVAALALDIAELRPALGSLGYYCCSASIGLILPTTIFVAVWTYHISKACDKCSRENVTLHDEVDNLRDDEQKLLQKIDLLQQRIGIAEQERDRYREDANALRSENGRLREFETILRARVGGEWTANAVAEPASAGPQLYTQNTEANDAVEHVSRVLGNCAIAVSNLLRELKREKGPRFTAAKNHHEGAVRGYSEIATQQYRMEVEVIRGMGGSEELLEQFKTIKTKVFAQLNLAVEILAAHTPNNDGAERAMFDAQEPLKLCLSELLVEEAKRLGITVPAED